MTDDPATDPASASRDAGHARLDTATDTWLAAQRATFDIMRGAADVPDDDTDRAEGYRWVTRMASLVLDWFVEKADPVHPQLFQLQDEYRKLLVDNPDVRYLFAHLDDRLTYRLTGTRGDAAYVGLTFGTPLGQGAVGGRTGTTTQADLDRFELGPGGEVDVLITPAGALPDPPPANVVVLEPGTGQLAVRETFFDKRRQRHAELRLELVGVAAPPVLVGDDFAAKLEAASLMLQFVAATACNLWRASGANVNSFGGTAGTVHVESQEDEVRSHSDTDMTYHGGRFVLAEGEALVVTVRPPPRPFLYWGLTLTNPWMESYDDRYTTTNLNNRRASPSPDGSWRLVVCPTDPGVGNWLDTGGRREGYMIVRWVLADDPPHPTCEVVPVERLGAPAGVG